MPQFSVAEISAFFQIVMIDISLAGDNAIVIGIAASGLPASQRAKAILFGIMGATVLRILFALFTVQLLKIPGLMFIGGVLLCWVSWKMYCQLRYMRQDTSDETGAAVKKSYTMIDAIKQIVIADFSMSLDNVLAVAGAAREHTWVLVSGLILSIALMGAASSVIERIIRRYHWIAYAGLLIIVYVAAKMLWDGGQDILTSFV
ncbi:MAG: TerC family protein [Alphaproteobacteria bacterium]|nr:TerC family protein [Alphaproteobacteria bacterium]